MTSKTSKKVEEKVKGTAKAKAKAKGAAKGKAKAKAGAKKFVSEGDEDPEDPEDPIGDMGGDRDAFHEMVVKDVLKCLETCKAAGCTHVKGKHDHTQAHESYELKDDLSWNIYWSRNAASVKKGKQQICYFSRPSPCCGTNIVLARHWVRISVVQLLYVFRFSNVPLTTFSTMLVGFCMSIPVSSYIPGMFQDILSLNILTRFRSSSVFPDILTGFSSSSIFLFHLTAGFQIAGSWSM